MMGGSTNLVVDGAVIICRASFASLYARDISEIGHWLTSELALGADERLSSRSVWSGRSARRV
jgi:hypothetical protein